MTNKRNNNVTKITIEVQHPETKPNRQEIKKPRYRLYKHEDKIDGVKRINKKTLYI